jgi:large subunit ribosomal protein L10
MTFVSGDAAAAAKALRDFRRSTGNTLLEFKGGWMNGAGLSPAEIDAIAQLPSREILYGRLVGMVASPLTGLAAALGGLIGGLARQLQAIADQGLVGDAAPAPAAEEAAPAAEAAAPAPEPEAAPAAEADTPQPEAAPAAEDTSSTETQED